MHSKNIRRWCACLLLVLGTAPAAMADNVATIGTVGYETLAAAFAAATDKQTVTLAADIDAFGSISLTSKTLTLDLNGHTAKGTSITVSTSTARLTITDGTAKDAPAFSTEDNSVAYTSGVLDFTDSKGYIYVNKGGSVEVQGGKVMSDYYTPFFVQGNTLGGDAETRSTLTVSGGYVYGRWYGASIYGLGSTMNVTGGLVYSGGFAITGNGSTNQGGTHITVSGGTLVSNVTDGMSCAIYHPQSGTLKITGGQIYSIGGCGILMRGGSLDMTGGTITATGTADQTGQVGDAKGPTVPACGIVFDKSAGYPDAANVSVEVSGTASVSGPKAAISVLPEDDEEAVKAVTVYAGTFSSDMSQFLAEGAKQEGSDGSYSAVTQYVAKVGDTKYETLAAAFSDATSGSTIVALAPVTMTDAIKFTDKSLTLDLNGKDLTLKGIYASTGAQLTVKDATATAAPIMKSDYSVSYRSGTLNVANSLQAELGGSVTVESGTVRTTVPAAAVLWSNGNTKDSGDDIVSTVTVSGGYVEGFYYGIAARGRKATVNVTGGIVLSQAYTINGNGTDVANNRQGGTVINISGGTIIARNGKAEGTSDIFTVAVYHPQKGQLNISGGQLYSTYGPGVLMRGGTLSMTGGEVTALGDADFKGSVTYASGNLPISGIVIDKTSTSYSGNADMTAALSGESIRVKGACEAVTLVGTASEGTVSVTAGSYSSDMAAFCSEDYASERGEDGWYGVDTGVLLTFNDQGARIQDGDAFTLSDVSGNYLNRVRVTEAVSDATVTLNKNFNTAWTSFAVPFSFTLTEELLEKFSFAEIWDTELDKETGETTIEYIVMKAGETLNAYTSYLVKANAEGTTAITLTGARLVPTPDSQPQECSTLRQRFTFYATSENTYMLSQKGYRFSSDKQSLVATDNATRYIAPLSFYMTIQDKQTGEILYPTTSTAAPKAISVTIGGETTGISSVTTDTAGHDTKVYTLQGTFVGNSTSALPRGLYIVNGKKTVIR